MIVGIAIFAIVFSVLGYRHSRLRKHRTAIVELQRLGARMIMTDPESTGLASMDDSIGGWRQKLLAEPAVYVPLVGLQNPSLTDKDVREMVPYLNALIPLHGQNIAGESFIALDISNSPVMTRSLVEELSPQLAGCRFMGEPSAKPGPSVYHPGY
ncbi:hypothetical protein LOC67_27135 [Stieleria sp. JC731]|uniref:hypothetical protein n=1 Tax=Stieleria sp. JC731 TaxID=2894195 RepID=UPI001E52B879|nr:hypothetical protein [Stieleria sp. JC731]MCC9604245.1 hypothetical protein [Stieleria sp. JC731]